MMDENLTAEQREMLQHIRSTGYRMLDMINMSMNLYKMETGTYACGPRQTDLLPIVQDVLTELDSLLQANQPRTAVLLNGRTIPEQAHCFALGEQLLCYSMLSNLIKNAVEGAGENGQVQVDLQEYPDQVHIHIWNTGVIPERIQETFGNKYATWGKKMGTGLGVYSARLIAENMNGIFTWTSSLNAGTTVTVGLPRERKDDSV